MIAAILRATVPIHPQELRGDVGRFLGSQEGDGRGASSRWPTRGIGYVATISCQGTGNRFPSMARCDIGVRMKPGETALTVIPFGPSSSRTLAIAEANCDRSATSAETASACPPCALILDPFGHRRGVVRMKSQDAYGATVARQPVTRRRADVCPAAGDQRTLRLSASYRSPLNLSRKVQRSMRPIHSSPSQT